MKTRHLIFFAALLAHTAVLRAHPIAFNSTIAYSSTQPSGAPASQANWTGAAFDAANDATTYVAGDQPRRGRVSPRGAMRTATS